MSLLRAIGLRTIHVDFFGWDWWLYGAPHRAYIQFDHGHLIIALWPGHGCSIGYDSPFRCLTWEPRRLSTWRSSKWDKRPSKARPPKVPT